MLKKQRLTAAVAAAVCYIYIFSGISFAGILENVSDGKHSADIQPTTEYYSLDLSNWREISGWLRGMGVSYAYHSPYNFIVKPDLRFYSGSLEYNGQLDLSDSSSRGSYDGMGYLFVFQGIAGYDIKFSKTSSIMPYSGFGIRFFKIDLDEDLTYNTGSRIVRYGDMWYNTAYIPVGIKVNKNLNSGWSFDLTIEDKIPFSKPYRNGLMGSIEVQKRFKYINFALEPFIEYWNLTEIDRAISRDARIHQPSGDITVVGVNLKFRF